MGSQPERHEEEWLHDTAVAPMRYEFQAELWRQSSTGAWHFVTLPNDISDEIDAFTVSTLRGFGSVRVRVTVKSTTWSTSIFPDLKRGAYVLPIKKQVRISCEIFEGDEVAVAIVVTEQSRILLARLEGFEPPTF